MADDIPSSVIAGIEFVGRTYGPVKTLSGFRKPHHTVPDAANATTNAFLAKICACELAEAAEGMFQAVRGGFGYKRRELALELASPTAVLTGKDFTVEIAYALEASDPSRYTVTTVLRGLRDPALARSEPMTNAFAGRFSEISFSLRGGVSVEAVIDAIEAINGHNGLSVSYPSDCHRCEITLGSVDARICCTGAALDIVFDRTSAPCELIAAFAEVRAAFRFSDTLAALTG